MNEDKDQTNCDFNVSNKEILKLMKEGAEKICDNAIMNWCSERYRTDQETKKRFLNEWKIKKQRVNEVYEMLKKDLK